MVERAPNGSPWFGIVGWKKSGKTTLATKLISELTARGYRVATIKHAHHAFQIDDGETDSARHRRAGAVQVAVASNERWAIIAETPSQETAPDVGALAARLEPSDLILVEGFKQSPVPKIEARRREAHQTTPLGDRATNVVAIAADYDIEPADLPTLGLSDVKAIADFIVAWCGMEKKP